MSKLKLKPKKVKGRMRILKVLPYRNFMVYVREIMLSDRSLFEYLVPLGGEIYSSYMEILPRKGKTKLSKDEISQCTELLWAGATATIDTLLNIKPNKKEAGIVKVFEASRKSVRSEERRVGKE